MSENWERGGRSRQEANDSSNPTERERSSSPDRVLSAVANEQRRAILDSLNSASEKTLDYDALVDHVADTVRDEKREELSDDHRQRTRIALRHTHLPKLEELQLIDYEAETGHVQFIGGGLTQEILSLIESYNISERVRE